MQTPCSLVGATAEDAFLKASEARSCLNRLLSSVRRSSYHEAITDAQLLLRLLSVLDERTVRWERDTER